MPAMTDTAKWAIGAAAGLAVGIFGTGQVMGATNAALRSNTEAVISQETRIRTLEAFAASTTESLSWIRDALRTGRDPYTNKPLGR